MCDLTDGNFSSLSCGADQQYPLSDAFTKSWSAHKGMKTHAISKEVVAGAELLLKDMLEEVALSYIFLSRSIVRM